MCIPIKIPKKHKHLGKIYVMCFDKKKTAKRRHNSKSNIFRKTNTSIHKLYWVNVKT